MSTIVLNSLNYVGNGIINGLNSFVERSAGVVNGFRYLNNRVTLGSHSNISWKLSAPVVATDSDSCSCEGAVLRTAYAAIDVKFDRAATPSERAAVLASIRDLVASTNFGDTITSLIQTP